MNNIFGNFGGCNKNCCDNGGHEGFDCCWLIILMMLCGCNMNGIDPCTLILLLMITGCCGDKNHNTCC